MSDSRSAFTTVQKAASRSVGILVAISVIVGGLTLSDPTDPAIAAQAATAVAPRPPAGADQDPEPDPATPTIEAAPFEGGPVQKTDGDLELSVEPIDEDSSGDRWRAPMSGGAETLFAEAASTNTLTAVSVTASSDNCGSRSLVAGGMIRTCGTMYIAPGFPTNADGSPAGYYNGALGFGLIDGCGNVIEDGGLISFFGGIWYSGGTYRWISTRWLPFDLDSNCLGEWTATFTVRQTFPDGETLTASVSNTIRVTPDAPSAEYEWPEAQTYGQCAPQNALHADPVNSLTGAFTDHYDADLSMAALGAPLGMARSYSSNDDRVGAFGRGWSHTYDSELTVDGTTGDITHHDVTGSQRVFTRNSDGTYTAAHGIRDTLQATPSGWRLVTREGATSEFDGSGNLTQMRDRNGQGVDLAYQDGLLSTVTGSGRSISVTWTGDGQRIASVATSDNRTVSYDYDADGNLSAFINADGKATSYGYDAGQRLDSITDPNGNHPVRLTYDPTTGRAVEQLDARGGLTTFGWDDATQTATITDARGNTATDVYVNGYIVAQTTADGVETRYSWDENGLMRRISSAGGTTQFDYDSRGNLIRKVSPDTTRDESGNPRAELYTYNTAGDIVSTRDFNGNLTTYGYDAKRNLTTVTRPNIETGTGTAVSLTNTYNPDGTLATSRDAGGRVTTYAYDAQRNLTSVITPGGQKTTYEYDGSGRLVATVAPRGNIAGANPADHRSTVTYTPGNLVTGTTDALGRTTTVGYDDAGRATSSTDPLGNTTTTSYTADNHVASVQGADPTIPPATFEYDANGNVTESTTPGGVTTTKTYTPGNRVETVTSTGTGTYEYTYDAAGRLQSQTTPSGLTTTFTRTPIGGIRTVTYSDGTPTLTYSYDPNGNRVDMKDATGTTTYSYNALNLLATVTKGSDVWSYKYSNDGALTQRTLPGTAPQTLTYDADNRLTKVATSSAEIVAYNYDPTTGTVTTDLPGPVSTILEIDAAGQPARYAATTGNTAVIDDRYELDGNGSPVKITHADGSTDLYTYDDVNRLTAACYDTAACAGATDYIRWTYDGDGNQLTEQRPSGTTAYTYDAAGRQTKKVGPSGTTNFTYDADGNMITGGSTTYGWNGAGQLISSKTGNKTTSFTYDGTGRRVTASVGKSATEYVYEPTTGVLLAEREGTKTVRQYDYGTGPVGMTASAKTYSYATDPLGSIRAVFDSAGATQLTYNYEPYGAVKEQTSAGRQAPSNFLQFLGHYNLGGQYLLSNRTYDPAAGRFLSADPAAQPGTGYAYGNANPMAYVDPLGLDGIDWLGWVNGISTGVAVVAGVAAVVCTVAVICAPAAPVLGGIALVAGAVSLATDESTVQCVTGKGSCAALIAGAALLPLGGVGKVGGLAARTALTGSKAFTSLSYSGYGIASYTAQKALTAGHKGAIQAHHLIEKRFASQMGGSTDDWSSVVVTRDEHAKFTAAWREAIPYGDGTRTATRADVENAARSIYADYPEILGALGLN